jgi:hypothetical protein
MSNKLQDVCDATLLPPEAGEEPFGLLIRFSLGCPRHGTTGAPHWPSNRVGAPTFLLWELLHLHTVWIGVATRGGLHSCDLHSRPGMMLRK